MYYDYKVVRKKDRVIEYAIYSFFPDWELNELEDVVTLAKDDDIGKYVEHEYGFLYHK